MIDVKEILQSWGNAAFPTEEHKKKAEERARICASCESIKKVVLPVANVTVSYCGECGCPINKKTYSPKKSCPKKKWTV